MRKCLLFTNLELMVRKHLQTLSSGKGNIYKQLAHGEEYLLTGPTMWKHLQTQSCIMLFANIYSGQQSIDGQVRLVHLVRLVRLVCLQRDNFRLFLHQQTDKRQTTLCTMSNGKRIKKKITWAPFSVSRLPANLQNYPIF